MTEMAARIGVVLYLASLALCVLIVPFAIFTIAVVGFWQGIVTLLGLGVPTLAAGRAALYILAGS